MRIFALILSLVCVNAFAAITQEEFSQLRKQAEQGDAAAQCELGTCYSWGEGVQKDLVEAVKWYRKGAEQGDALSQYQLAVCYDKGLGVQINLAEAIILFRKSANQGFVNAQYNLAGCYEYGDGVQKDQVEAFAYFNLAAMSLKVAREERDILKKQMTPLQIEAGQKRSMEIVKEIEANIAAKKTGK